MASGGHPETFSDSAVQTCLTLKVLFGLPLRQTVGLVASLIEMAGLDWPVPDYSTLCRRQARIQIQIPYRRSGQPLNLLIDSTGIRFVNAVAAPHCRRDQPLRVDTHLKRRSAFRNVRKEFVSPGAWC